MEQLFVLPGGRLEWQEVPPPEVFPAAVEIDVHASAVSTGTETSVIRAWRDRAEGSGELGYTAAGTVRRVGDSAGGGFVPGQRVACYGGPYTCHATRLAVPWTLVARVPDDVSLEAAAFCGIGAIAMHAVRRGGFTPGSRVLVYGVGILGQLQAQVLRAWGCRALAADRCQQRLELARALGCDCCVNTEQEDLVAAAQAFAPAGLDGAIINTPLQPPMMDQAAAACRERGRIVMVGGGPEIRIAREQVFAKELDLLISRAGGPGRYDRQYEKAGQDLPPGFVRWTEGRNVAHFVEMLADRQINVEELITHRVPYRQAAQVYELLESEEKYSVMGAVFLYKGTQDG